MKKVFVINGPAGAGKDTFIEIVREFLAGRATISTYSAVDEVKRQLREREGWDGVTKNDEWRKRMYDLKMEMVADNDRPTRYLVERIIAEQDNSVVFLHIREPEEIAKLLRAYPEALTLHINREGIERFDNPADSQTLMFDYNYYIENTENNLEAFREIVRQFILENLNDLVGESEQISLGDFR